VAATAASAWDAEHLYFAVRVYDGNLFPLDDDPPDSVVIYMMDGIELLEQIKTQDADLPVDALAPVPPARQRQPRQAGLR